MSETKTSQLFRPDTVKILRTLGKNKVRLVDRREELRRKYPDEYVAFHDDNVVGHDKDFEKLKAALQRKYGTIDHVAIEFISSKKVQLIL